MNARSLLLIVISIVLITGGLFIRSRYSKTFHGQLRSMIEENVRREFTAVDNEASLILKDSARVSSRSWDDVSHFFVHVKSDRILTWNRSYFLPDIYSLSLAPDSVGFIKSSRGDFLIKRWELTDHSSLYCVLRLIDRYPIINNFLSSQSDPKVFPVKDIDVLDPSSLIGDSVFLNGKTVFKLAPEKPDIHESEISFILLLSGLMLLIWTLWKLKTLLEKSFGFEVAIGAMILVFLALRMGMIAISFPALFLASDIFDPKKFASSSLNASLGDLFFNAISLLVLVIYLFRNFEKFKIVQWILQRSGIQRSVAGTLCLLACFFALLFPYDFIESIYHNSTLALDLVQSLSFDKAGIIAVIAVLIGCVSSFLSIHVLFTLANHLFEKRNTFFIGLAVAALIFIGQSFLLSRDLWITLLLGIFFFSVLKITKLNGGVFRISFQVFIYCIFSLSLFSFQNALAVRIFYKEKQVQEQLRFGKDFLTDRDVLGEYLLDQARQRIEKDQFIQTRMASLFLSKSAVADKIRRVYLNNYFDRYEIEITTQKQEELAESQFENGDSVTLRPNNFLLTGYPGVSYAKSSGGSTVKRYQVLIPIYYQRPVGVVRMDLSLKRVIPENVYPELLVDNRFNQIYRNRDFSYAVFTKGKWVSSFGPFNYEKDFQIRQIKDPALYLNGITNGKYFHIGIEDQDGSVAVVSADTYPVFYLIANFSFWFVFGLAFLFAGQAIVGIFTFFSGEKVNYTSRIQLVIFLAFLLPVIAVSITTLTLIGRSNEESIQKDFLARSETISQRIAGLVSSDSSDVANEGNLDRWIQENAATSKIDISVYSPDGKLMATSQPALFENQLISPLLEREAWKKIVMDREVQAVTNEQIGKLRYSCAYSSVRSPETGTLKAIVGLPFFESASFLQRSQSLIVSNILIVFVVVFILFSVLSFWAASSLTFPIRFITKTLGQTTLTGQNKPLQWNSSDEIGTLVKEYNRMVENLEESKRAIAQSEKESAWREMAKQVAHEIKNPLTPMKLTLQQMEQMLKTGDIPADRSRKSVDVLLKQVEILNEIAASFSTFASMPSPSPRKTDLNELIQGAVSLFGAETNGNILFEAGTSNPFVLVDPTSFSRAISNILINALQSRKDNQDKVDIVLISAVKENSVLITIRDNGKGMTSEIQEKIFQPQFTTKKTGSGLGLAMTRQIIGQAGGKIWFESTIDIGSAFFIELPRFE